MPHPLPPQPGTGGNEDHVDPSEVEKNFDRIEPATKWQYDFSTRQWSAESIWVQLDPKPFTEGSMRMVFHLKDYSLPDEEQTCVAKMSKNPSEGREVYFLEVEMQTTCQAFANEFNKHDPPKKVKFVKPYLVEFHNKRGHNGFGNLIMGVEQALRGAYKKYSNNYGFVSPEHRNTPQCFSHWTYKYTRGQMLICDLQGVGDLYTDPQIHSLNLQFGQADLGSEGMHQFFNTHICNALCDFMGLSAKSQGSCSHCTLAMKKKLQREKQKKEKAAAGTSGKRNSMSIGSPAMDKKKAINDYIDNTGVLSERRQSGAYSSRNRKPSTADTTFADLLRAPSSAPPAPFPDTIDNSTTNADSCKLRIDMSSVAGDKSSGNAELQSPLTTATTFNVITIRDSHARNAVSPPCRERPVPVEEVIESGQIVAQHGVPIPSDITSSANATNSDTTPNHNNNTTTTTTTINGDAMSELLQTHVGGISTQPTPILSQPAYYSGPNTATQIGSGKEKENTRSSKERETPPSGHRASLGNLSNSNLNSPPAGYLVSSDIIESKPPSLLADPVKPAKPMKACPGKHRTGKANEKTKETSQIPTY
eukprot:TRINITY_DN68179_c8_g5_i1.p1 TRINITY_DN68179_c8_g5~~TRINITY_DN68179_c8_g5_i1.p1  ORF type:complete len:590 (-),score=64.53 TRINITY_DN68179_c8_g5_i1:301-2070(-)